MIPFDSVYEARGFFFLLARKTGHAGEKSFLVKYKNGVRRVTFMVGMVLYNPWGTGE